MQYSFVVTGMSCAACVKTIETALSKLPNVAGAKVDFATKTLVIEALQPTITLTQLNKPLSETPYRIIAKSSVIPQAENTRLASLKIFLPLIIAFTIILGCTVVMLIGHGSWDNVYAMRHFEGAFFVIFGLLKLLNWRGFVEAYRRYDVLAKRSVIYAYSYPLIELGLGAAYLLAWQLMTTASVTLLLMIIGAIGVAQTLRKKQHIQCACMGAVFKVPMTTVTLVEDLLMGIMALAMIVML